MAKSADDVPPIPVPPVEPTPTAAVIPPLVDLTSAPTEAPRPDPYAPAAVNPYYQPQAQPGDQQPYAYQPYQAGPPTGLSLASMIVGILGVVGSLMWIGLLPSIAAVILGHMASKRQPYAKGFWLTGLITGYVGIAFSIIGILFFVVIFALSATSAGYDSYY